MGRWGGAAGAQQGGVAGGGDRAGAGVPVGGVAGVLASLRAVDETSTVRLMEEFFAHLGAVYSGGRGVSVRTRRACPLS